MGLALVPMGLDARFRHRTGDASMPKIEAFTAQGVVSGSITVPGATRAGFDTSAALELDRATWYPIAGGPAERRPRVHLEPDELLVLCEETADLPVHSSWHDVVLAIGPFRVGGTLPTMPGFDPGRALARPGGPFILLRDVRVELVGHPESGRVERPHALVNRYAVEEVDADIDLGYFFPGAQLRFAVGHPLA